MLLAEAVAAFTLDMTARRLAPGTVAIIPTRCANGKHIAAQAVSYPASPPTMCGTSWAASTASAKSSSSIITSGYRHSTPGAARRPRDRPSVAGDPQAEAGATRDPGIPPRTKLPGSWVP